MQGAIIKSFTYNNHGGNGAGVVILNEKIDSIEKQRIAAKIGLSETAFVLKVDESNFDVSFFTPECEVDLCGHATIAAFYYLGMEKIIKPSEKTMMVHQNTKAGKLEIEIIFNENAVDYVLMQMASPKIYAEIDGANKIRIAKSLNILQHEIGLVDYSIEPTIVSTGLKDIIIPVKSRKILNSINPYKDMIFNISEENDVVGYHVYTIENNRVYARNFAPLVGIDEECATGTSNGALASLLFMRGISNGDVEIIQGESMNETSMIYVKVKRADHKIDVRVGGKSSIIKKII